MRRLALLPIILIVAVAFSACSKADAPTPAPATPSATGAAGQADLSAGKALFQELCTTCHPSDRSTSRTETRDEWVRLVGAMQKKAGRITDADAAKIVDYLSAEYGRK